MYYIAVLIRSQPSIYPKILDISYQAKYVSMYHCLLFNLHKPHTDNSWARTSGIHRIANHLREQGWDAEVIDFAIAWSFSQLEELAKSRITSNTKFIGFSHMFQMGKSLKNWPASIEKFCAYIKQTYPDIVIITGSQHNPNFISDKVDYSVTGYGEHALDALLKYKFSNGPRPKFNLIKGLAGQKLIHALESYPAHPMREPTLIYEDRDFIFPGEWSTIEFSRGCKFSCSFCNFPVLGVKGDYTRTAEGFRNHIMTNYDRFGIENYMVSDETFNDSTEKITKFADVVETLPWKPYFTGFLRADLLVSRPKDKEELLRMGFLGHFYGIESFNHATGKIIGKGMDPSRLQQGLIDVKKYLLENSNNTYRGMISIIYGLPLETKESLCQTEEWLLANWRDQSLISWGLDLTDNDMGASHSKLSLNYSKYGYKKIEGPYDFKRYTQSFYSTPGNVTITEDEDGDKDDVINWKNENMDLSYAMDKARIIKNKFPLNGGFQIGNLLINKNTNKSATIEERLSITSNQAGWNYTDFTKFISNYIDKKLSL